MKIPIHLNQELNERKVWRNLMCYLIINKIIEAKFCAIDRINKKTDNKNVNHIEDCIFDYDREKFCP